MIPVIEAPFRTALMAGLGGLHRAAAGQGPAVRRAVGVATVARRTDREEAVTPAAGLLAEGLVHGVGARGATSDWTASPNRDTTGATGSVCRSSRRSRGSGGTRALTLVFPPVRYPTDRVDTTTGAMDAAALMDAHDASTRCLQNRPEGGFAQRPQPVIFLLIKNPEEPRDRTDATTRVQICALSRERRQRQGSARSAISAQSLDKRPNSEANRGVIPAFSPVDWPGRRCDRGDHRGPERRAAGPAQAGHRHHEADRGRCRITGGPPS